MKRKTTYLKSLLISTLLILGGVNSWANDSFGSLDQGWWTNFSQTYTLEGYGKFHFQFTTTNANDGVGHKTWLLVATNGADSHGSGGTEYFAWRGDGYAWGQGKNSNPYDETNNAAGDPERLVCSNTYATTNPSGVGLQSAMNGAKVDMVITRTSTNIFAEATVTPTLEGENPFTMSFSYLFGNATSENIGLFFEVENSTMDISTAENYYGISRYSQDMEDATNYTTGWTLGANVVAAQSSINNTNQLYLNVNKNKVQRDNTLALSTNSAYFGTVEEYIFSFQYGYSHGNGNAIENGMTLYAPNNTTLFSVAQPGNYGSTNTISNAEGTSLATFNSEYNKGSKGVFLTFVVTGSKSSNNVKLSVINGNATIVDNVTISNAFQTVDKLYLQMTGGASHYFFDNMILKEHVSGAVAEDPSFTFNRVSGDNRVYTITNPNGEGTLYYTTATAAEAPAVGDAAYSSTTEASIDVPFGTGTYYAYAVLADGTTTSAVISQEVTGGAIQLVKPYYNIVSYDANTANTTVTLNTNVSGLLGTPTATIKYIIGEGEEQTTANGGTVLVADGSTITFYAEAEGYTTSESVSVTATAPNSNPVLWSETYKGKVSSDKGFTLGTDVVATENTTSYYYLYYDGTTLLSENLLANGVYSNNMLRSNGYYSGQNAVLALHGLKKGDYVTFTGAYGNGAFVINANSTDLGADAWHTISGSQYCYTVKRDCSARFSLDRYGYLQSITVQRALETRGATVGSTGYATFAADVDLDLSTLTEGFKAYFASSAANGKVMMTKATDEKIAAGEGLFIQGSGAFTITETRDATADVDNYLVAGDGVEGGIVKEDGFDKYVLGADGGSVSFFLINATAATVPTNKAYLKVPATGNTRLAIVFDNDLTGINSVERTQADTEDFYNLNGQRVVAPAKGLYIMNGKKVIIK